MDGFFTTNFGGNDAGNTDPAVYNSSLSSSFQGQLSSSYTEALKTYLADDENNDAAEYVGWLALQQQDPENQNLDAAIEVMNLVKEGLFSLSGLFGAAQSKTGVVDGDSITNPVPTLTVTLADGQIVTVVLTDMLAGLDTETWTTTDTAKVGKTTTTTTTYHTREFYTEVVQPGGDAYDPDWFNPAENLPPLPASFDETVTEFDIKAGPPVEDNNLVEINLLQNAVDPESETLNVSGDVTVTLDGVDVPTDTFWVDGNTLVIDTNSGYFDDLYKDQKWTFDVTYNITDGENVVPSAGTVEVTGTADQFTQKTNITSTVTSFPTSLDGDLNFTITDAPTGAFDFTGTVDVTVTGDIGGATDQNEYVTVSFEGGDSEKLIALDTNSQDPGKNNYVAQTDTAEIDFASPDAQVTGSFDSNDLNGTPGVDGLTLIAVTVTDYQYWL